MPKGIYPRGGQQVASSVSTNQESGPAPMDAPTKMIKMELKRNYVPLKPYNIVGYERPARMVKNAAGELKEAEPAAFVEGETFPPLFAGVGFDGKIWAKTVIEVPEAEAKVMRQKGIAEAYL